MHTLVSFLLAASFAVAGSQSAPDTAAPASQRVNGAFFALSVSDAARISTWYRDVLGLRITSSGEAPNKIAKFAILEGDGVVIEIIEHSKAKPRNLIAPTAEDSYQIHGIFKTGVIVADIDTTYRAIKGKGVAIAYDLMPAKDVPMRSFAVRDPEGNLLQFFGK